MEKCVWLFFLLSLSQVVSLRPPNRSQWQPTDLSHSLRRSIYESESRHPILRRGSPYFLITPINANKRPKTNKRLLLTLPKDNIQILNAEAMAERGSQILPTTLTLSFKNTDKQFSHYGTPRGYVSQIPPARFQYGFMSESDEDEKARGEVSYEMEDLEGSSGGHVTVVKGHPAPPPKFLSARKVNGARQSTLKAMKAIIIQPKEIQAKRVRVVETSAEKVSPSKGRFIKAGEPMFSTAVKAKFEPVHFKKATISKSKGEDWAASNIHFTNAEPPPNVASRHQDSSMADLQCGGNNDLGWCDLGANYPSTEVSQILEVCEELLSRMYVEVPISSTSMEDIASYSLARNLTENAYWPWKESLTTFKKSLCQVERNIIQPSFAQDIRGKWHVIIQTQTFPQTIALEVCSKPGDSCEFCNTNQSQCVQKYSHQQLISFDPESAETCPYIRLYKFPSSCVCRIAE